MGTNAWTRGGLSNEDNEELTRPFTKEEVRKVIFSMKENSALGPNIMDLGCLSTRAAGR